jgi:HEPN domain-containing protein
MRLRPEDGCCMSAPTEALAAEKYLQAILVSRRHPFPRTHDLIALHDLYQIQ